MSEQPEPKKKFSFDQKVAVISAVAGVASVGLAILSAPFIDRMLKGPEPAPAPAAVYVVPQEALAGTPAVEPSTPADNTPRPTSGAVPTTKAPSGTIDRENGKDDWLQERTDRRQVADMKIRTPTSLLAARGDIFVVETEGGRKQLLLVSDKVGDPTPVGERTSRYTADFVNDGDIDVRNGPATWVYRRVGEYWEGCILKAARIGDVTTKKLVVRAKETVHVELDVNCIAMPLKNKSFPEAAAGRLVIEAYPADTVFPGETPPAAKAPD